jgi:hypothetical protein
MPNVRYSLIVALLLSSVFTAGYAQPYYIVGLGLNSCGQYLSAVHNHPPGKSQGLQYQGGATYVDEATRYLDWLAGFVSASNGWIARTDTGNGVKADYAAIDVWMRRWCEQNPTKLVIEAASEFVLKNQNWQ